MRRTASAGECLGRLMCPRRRPRWSGRVRQWHQLPGSSGSCTLAVFVGSEGMMAKKRAEGGNKKKKKKQYVVFRLQSESLDKEPADVDDSLVCEVEPGRELPPVAELLGAVQRRLVQGDQDTLDLLEAWRVWMREWAVELLRAAERSNEDIDYDPAKLTGLAFGILMPGAVMMFNDDLGELINELSNARAAGVRSSADLEEWWRQGRPQDLKRGRPAEEYPSVGRRSSALRSG